MKKAYPSLRLAAAAIIALGGTLAAHPVFAEDTDGLAEHTADSTDTSGMPDRTNTQAAATTPDSMQKNMKTEVKVKDLNKSPDKFAGQDVMVKGKISKIEGAGAFILEGSGLLNNKILVVIAKPGTGSGGQSAGATGQQAGTQAPVIKEKAKVQLMGHVEQIDLTKVEEQYQPGLKAEIKEEFEGSMPVLVVPPSGFKVMH